MTPLVLDGGRRQVTADPPVVLAPMAGVTNVPFRTLCRRYGGGLFVSEMVGARALIDAEEQGAIAAVQEEVAEGKYDDQRPTGREKRLLRAAFGPDEVQRSIQLYATEPAHLREGVAVLDRHDLVDHIDLNFGCPAPKVTRHGGGAALPWRTGLFFELVAAAVEAAGGRPVTVKVRKGIDDDHLTYRDAGRAARDAGAVAITLHGRTAEEAYAGHADWDSIATLVETVGDDMAVLGNGDIWAAEDALRMIDHTGCHGVVVGRGCLGRPWLFRDLQAALTGQPVPPPPGLTEVCAMLAEHGELLVAHMGELAGMRDIRKHVNWYLQGFAIGKAVRLRLRQVERLDELRSLLADLDEPAPMPAGAMQMRRGHTHGPKPVKLPHGWLASRDHRAPLAREAAAVVSGG
ncbi:tRNA dihydrouridine synthase [Euzebya tangerina]|uniref:tRNA dihydrouridine synthase n=1 Tax=Euzebya tangerina TaxID=591198 RepID=UPI000E31D9AE|nr:tRNA-dihydrouridine synthase [Euzebya tangerina]